MKLGWESPKRLARQLDKEKLRRRNREKSAEEFLGQKSSDDRENRPALTGYKPLKEEEPSLKETVRMENSRGILALGGDERKKPAIVVTEKSHPNGPAVQERERVLEERGKREYPQGSNRILSNPGERERGAVGFLLRPAATCTQAMDLMKHYMENHDQKTLGRMMPFLVTEKELQSKQKLEETLQEARREARGPMQEKTVKMLDDLLAEKKEELIRRRQKEVCFSRKLEKALQEEKKTVWEDFSDQMAEMRKISLPKAGGPSDIPAEEEQEPEEEDPKGKKTKK